MLVSIINSVLFKKFPEVIPILTFLNYFLFFTFNIVYRSQGSISYSYLFLHFVFLHIISIESVGMGIKKSSFKHTNAKLKCRF